MLFFASFGPKHDVLLPFTLLHTSDQYFPARLHLRLLILIQSVLNTPPCASMAPYCPSSESEGNFERNSRLKLYTQFIQRLGALTDAEMPCLERIVMFRAFIMFVLIIVVLLISILIDRLGS